MKNVKRKKLGRRILSFILSAVLVVGLMPGNVMTVSAEDTATVSADEWFTVSGNTVTIDGTLGGKTTATEDDITALVDAIKGYVDSGVTTIIVTGEEPAMITITGTYSYTTTAIGEAIFRLSGSGNEENSTYLGKIDLILPDVTEIVEYEFQNAHALNSINLPKVTTIGVGGIDCCYYLQELTFGSVVTSIKEDSSPAFTGVGDSVDGGLCDLVLSCGQITAAEIGTTRWWAREWKSITLAHSGGEATCTTRALCAVCAANYGEVDPDNHTGTLGTYAPIADGSQHAATWSCCNKVETADHTAEPTYTLNTDDSTKHNVTYSCCDTFTEAHSGGSYSVSGAVITDSCTKCGTELGTATISATGKTYDGAAVEATVPKIGSLENETIAITYAVKDGATLEAAPATAGTYTASIKLGEGENAVTATVEFEIKKADSAVTTAPTPIANLAYNGSEQNLINAGTTTDGTMQYSLEENGTYSTTIPTGTNAGTYIVWYKVDGDENHNDTTPASVEVTIAPKTLEISSVTASNRVFDGTNKVEISEVIIGGIIDADNVSASATATIDSMNAGEYSAVDLSNITLTGSENYSIEASAEDVLLTIPVTISKAAAPTLPRGSKAYVYSKSYEGESVSITGLPTDCGEVSYSLLSVSGDMFANVSVDASSGKITYDVKALDSYTEDLQGTIAVNVMMENYNTAVYALDIPRTEKLPQNISAENISLTYGDADTTISVTGAKTELTYEVISDTNDNGDVVTVDTNGKVSIKNAGTAIIRITANESDNYAASECEITVTVNKAAVTVTAKSYTIKAGDTLPTYAYDVTGLVNNEQLPIDVTISCNAADSNTAGTYAITVSGAANSTNYTFAYVNGTLTVSNKEEQTITASDVTLTYGETGKKISATTNGGGAITYTIATGTDVISVAADGTITVLKAGTATVTIRAAETADYAEAAKTITVTVNKAENAPNMPSAAINVAYGVETVSSVTLPDGWVWKAEDASKALTAGTAVTVTAVYNGADAGNYETETVEVAITRSAGGNTGGGYYPPYYPSYPVVTPTPVPTVAPTPTVVPTATPTVAPTIAPTVAPSATPTPVPGTTTVPTSGETVVDANGEEVTSIVQEPGTTNKLVIPGLTDVEPEEGEEAAPVVWKSSNPDVAEVDENGNITMKEPGLAEIVVTVGEGNEAKTETIVVLVEEARTYVNPLEEAFKDVRLGTSWGDILLVRYQKAGETVDINFYGVKNWKQSNYEYIWETSDESVAVVDGKGRVTALKPGVVELTLGLKNKADGHFLNVQSVEIVVPGDYENKILLGTSKYNTFDSIVLNLNERIDINFYGVKNWKREDYEYYWSSSEPSVVWVDNLGRLVPVKPGKAEVFLVLVEKKNKAPRYVVPVEVTVPEKTEK